MALFLFIALERNLKQLLLAFVFAEIFAWLFLGFW